MRQRKPGCCRRLRICAAGARTIVPRTRTNRSADVSAACNGSRACGTARFCSVFSTVCNEFRPGRHAFSASNYRTVMRERWREWDAEMPRSPSHRIGSRVSSRAVAFVTHRVTLADDCGLDSREPRELWPFRTGVRSRMVTRRNAAGIQLEQARW